MFTLIKNNDCNYRFKNSKAELSQVNDSFIKFINDNGISSVNLTSVGNSIATGYSMNDSIKPLLLRNEDLIKRCNFKLNLRAYARAQDNNDEHIFDWFLNNVKQSDINKKVQLDFISDKGMPHGNIYNSDVIKYYPTEISDDIGLRDLVSLEASLKLIYLRNPYTQVYVCGIPNIAGVGITNLVINSKIRKVCKNYPNCVYISPVKQNFMYRKNDKLVVDVHYSDDEYLNLNKVILESIVNNYFPVKALTEFDVAMKKYSDVAEYGSKSDIDNIIDSVFSNYDLNDKQLKEISKYFKERYPYDFYYTPRRDVINDIKSRRNK